MNALFRGASYGAVIITAILSTIAIGIWFERKFAGRMQSRLGPTIVGPVGLFQPLADVVKLLQKEDIVPRDADRSLFDLAPILATLFALGAAAVVPFSATAVTADLDIGVLWILAIGALMVIPTFMAGWASNNKFALLGGMRAVAQAVSYAVPLVLAVMVPVILSGTMQVSGIVQWQQQHHWVALWPVIPGLPAFVLFFLAMLAESNRIPFDIPEAESELVAGITTEYTGAKFTLFYMAEYVHTLVGSAVGASLFLGGWDGPFAPGLHWMVLKTLLLFAAVYWVRWSLLRFRSDQLMDLCWKWLTPIGVFLVLAAATWVQLMPGGR
ncbi:MAG: NADH-quinone oxidoreductase subunit NuoH [Deltaproteobacteria bacterium]|nr:NADH-quinone oxidoreductase subunit NuoH [Deltaproteobacteria bacterium]